MFENSPLLSKFTTQVNRPCSSSLLRELAASFCSKVCEKLKGRRLTEHRYRGSTCQLETSGTQSAENAQALKESLAKIRRIKGGSLLLVSLELASHTHTINHSSCCTKSPKSLLSLPFSSSQPLEPCSLPSGWLRESEGLRTMLCDADPLSEGVKLMLSSSMLVNQVWEDLHSSSISWVLGCVPLVGMRSP